MQLNNWNLKKTSLKSKDKRQSDASEDFEDEIEQLKIENKKLVNIIVKLQEDKKNRKGIVSSIHHQVKNSKKQRNTELNQKKRECGVESIIVGGDDEYNILGEKHNNKTKSGHLIISPPVKLSLDTSLLLSCSAYGKHAVLVTSNGSLKGVWRNYDGRVSSALKKTIIEDFTDFCIKDDRGQLAAVSAVCYWYGALYMFSKSSCDERLVLCDDDIN